MSTSEHVSGLYTLRVDQVQGNPNDFGQSRTNILLSQLATEATTTFSPHKF